jgi:uncharacterized protein
MSNRGLDVLPRDECNSLLHQADFGRVIAKIGDTISALPVFYAIADDDIVFRTDPGTKLAAAVLHTRVTFEVDDRAEGWSVMVVGFCDEVRAPAAVADALEMLGDRWPESERQRVVRIHPERITGRRLRIAARPSPPTTNGG